MKWASMKDDQVVRTEHCTVETWYSIATQGDELYGGCKDTPCL